MNCKSQQISSNTKKKKKISEIWLTSACCCEFLLSFWSLVGYVTWITLELSLYSF